MGNTVDQKIRLLVLYDLLQSKTDENHRMTTAEIINALAEKGVSANRKTLYSDIELLNKYGYEVLSERGQSNSYYVVSRKFEQSEVQVLLSAVSSAQFLSKKKTNILIQKLLQLLGMGEAEDLVGLLGDNTNKRNNERVYYNIDAIITGIIQKKQVSFLYFDYGLNSEKAYRKNKERYVINPLGLAYSEDKLYLICYHDKYDTPTNYRIDRMDEVRAEESDITRKLAFADFDIDKYRREQFNMFGGKTEKVTLEFSQKMTEVVFDRFGEDINIAIGKNGNYLARVPVQISKTFFAWLTTFEGDIKIVEPSEVLQEYRDFLKNNLGD